MDPKRANKEARCSKMDQNFMKIHAKSNQKTIKIHQKSMPDRGPEKNMIFYEKSDAWDSIRLRPVDSKVVQNGIQKSSKIRYRKSMPK